MKKKRDVNQKAHSGKGKNSSPPVNGRSALFSNDWTGTMGTKRQTYHIHIDLIAKLQGYAYWERRMISEVVNCALEEFFKDKEIKPRPPKKNLSKKKR